MEIFDKNIYDNFKVSDLLKEIHQNTRKKDKQLKEITTTLQNQISDGGANVSVMMAPILATYIDTQIKNDEHLIKLAGVLQKMMSEKKEDSESGLTQAEKDQLFSIAKEIKDTPVLKLNG